LGSISPCDGSKTNDFSSMKIYSGLLLPLFLSLVACAAHKPYLERSSHFQSVGEEAAGRDITACEKEVLDKGTEYGETRGGRILQGGVLGALLGAIIGAVGGATSGTSGIAALITASVLGVGGAIAGAVTPLEPSPNYKGQVDDCLREKGYEPKGWK